MVTVREKTLEVLKKDVIMLLKLLLFFKKTTTSYMIAKKLFNVRDSYELKKRDMAVKFFLNRWNQYGVLKREDINGKTFYSIDPERIVYGDAKITIKLGKTKKTFNLGATIGILDKDDNWIFFQLKEPK